MTHKFWYGFCTCSAFRKFYKDNKGHHLWDAIEPVSMHKYEVSFFLHDEKIAVMECSRTDVWDAVFDCGEALNLDMGEVAFQIKKVPSARYKVVAYEWYNYPSVGIGRNLKEVVTQEIERLDGTIGHLTELRPFKVGC